MHDHEEYGSTDSTEIILNRTLITAPNIILDEDSDPVIKFDRKLIDLANDMKYIMHKHNGIGLAAIQIAVPKRVVAIDTTPLKTLYPNEEPFVGILVNPEFTKLSDTTAVLEEGCLSFPGARVTIRRPTSISVSYLNLSGKPMVREFNGIAAQCIQHEIDHLNGITMYKRRQMGEAEKVIEKV